MERSTIVKDFNGCKQQPVIISSSMDLSFAHNNNILPFQPKKISSYHQSNDESEISIFDAQKYFNDSNIDHAKPIRNNRVVAPPPPEQQISIPRISSASSADGYGRNLYKIHSFHATPTESSEASWNSQTGLLSNPPGAFAVSLTNPDGSRGRKSTSKWSFGITCPCSGKNSVQVQKKLPEPKTIANPKANSFKPVTHADINLRRISSDQNQFSEPRITTAIPNIATGHLRRISADHNHFSSSSIIPASEAIRPFAEVAPPPIVATGFTFPILNNQSAAAPVKVVINAAEEDPPRNSLEVFRLPSVENQNRLPVTRRSFTFLGSPKSKLTTVNDDDEASDASSDLFEIESFSTQTATTALYRDSLDDAPSFNAGVINGSCYNSIRRSLDEPVTMTSPNGAMITKSCYEPSEVSIDWSVTTAEVDDVSHFAAQVSNINYGGKKKGRGGSGGGGELLSCRSEKAVSVGPQPVKFVGGERQKEQGPHDTTRHVRSRPQGFNAGKPPLARSHSASLTLPFTR